MFLERSAQYTLEMFYRLQLFEHCTVNGDVQLLIDPALAPTVSQVWVYGLAARLSF